MRPLIRCGRCIYWEITMYEGHNLGYCLIKKLIYSRFTKPPCKEFKSRGYEPPEAIYGINHRD